MLKKSFIVIFWLLIWHLTSLLVHNNIMLAGPVNTIIALKRMILTGEYWQSILFSTVRIMGGFFIGSIIGILQAWLSYREKYVEDILKPFITTLKAIPVASFVIILLIWAGNKILSLYVSTLVVIPVLYLNTLSGLKATDAKLLEMAEVFRMPMLRKLCYIYLPSLYPFWNSSLQAALGMAWKSGVAAEVIGQPLKSVGNSLYQSKIYLETADLFAWTITIILTAMILEKLILKVLKMCIKA